MEIITAVYENNVLRPLHPLKLKEHEKVRIQILPDEPAIEREQEILKSLVKAGHLTPPPGNTKIDPLSKKERRELADRMGRALGKPLSEIIIEERGVL